MRLLRSVALIASLLSAWPAGYAETGAIQGDVPLELKDVHSVALPGYIACAITDPTYQLTFEEIRARETDLTCRRTRNDSPSFSLIQAAVWLRFQVVNRTRESIWYLQLMPNIDRIEFYQVDDSDQATQKTIAGRMIPYDKYEIKHRNHLFTINVPPGESATIYLRIQSAGPLWAGLSLYSRGEFLEIEQREQFIFGAYFSALLVIALLNLFFLLATRKIVYVYYLAYLLGFSLLIFTLHGYSYQIFWPNSPNWNVHSVLSLALFTIVFALLFTQGFLEYSRRSPFHITVNILCVFLAGLGVISAGTSSTILWNIALPSAALGVGMVFIAGFHRLAQGFRPAIFFVAGWCMMALLMFQEALALAGIISFEYISHYQVLAASAMEMLFFTMALAYRHYLLGHEKELAENRLQQERDRLASEIHDSLGAELTSMIVNLESSAITNNSSDVRAEDFATNDYHARNRAFARRLRSTLQKLRDIVYLTKHSEIEAQPVSVAFEIQEFANRLTATGQYTIQCELSPVDEATLKLKNSLHVVRIFQEWMTNIVRHTGSAVIRVRWRSRGTRRCLVIQNDQSIFQWRDSSEESVGDGVRKGVGLENIRWRSRELGGRARAMRQGHSTVFAVCIPEPGAN